MLGCPRSLDWKSNGNSRCAVACGAALYEDKRLFAPAGEARPGGRLKPDDISPTPTPVTGVDGFGAKLRPKLIGSRPSAPLPEPPGLALKKFLLLPPPTLSLLLKKTTPPRSSRLAKRLACL